jgi:checkpoint serine/threonine-protein kinase
LEKPCSALLGGDIMLVDFGRSIDMASIREPPLSNFFTGSICAEDMECIAMREGKPWAADVDTFGLCASAHVLLFGCHMEVEYDHTRCRWQLKKRFRRYWQKELWCKMFESLLNLAPGECHSIKLGEIRKDFETYLNGVRNDLMTFLKGQIGYLSKK